MKIQRIDSKGKIYNIEYTPKPRYFSILFLLLAILIEAIYISILVSI